MLIKTDPHGSYTVDCSDSEALVSLSIFTGIYSDQVTARFRSNPYAQYSYSVPKGEAVPTLVALDSAGRFMVWVKAVSDTFHRLDDLPRAELVA